MSTNVLIDGNNFAIRILTAIPGYNNQFKSNHQISLFIDSFLSGFLSTIKKIKLNYQIDNINLIWDSKINNRKLIYPEYKNNRRIKTIEMEKDKENHYSLLDRLKGSLKKLGAWADVRLEGYEADDLIAYFVKNSTYDNNFIILSSDNDLYQLLGDRCIMYLLNKKKFYSHIDFKNEFIVMPNKYPLVKALSGDSSDNIKGIDGIGIKKAIKLIEGGQCWQHFISKYPEVDLELNLELIQLPFQEHKIDIKIPQSNFNKSAWIELFQEYSLNRLNLFDFKKLLEK